MATEYIDKFSFAKYLDSHYCDRCKAILFVNNVDFHPRFCWSCRIKDVMNDLETYQTEDVVEQKHGKWKELTRYGMASQRAIYECSVCGGNAWVYDDEKRRFKYCPNCGASMVTDDV